MPLTLLAHQAAVLPFKAAAPRGMDGVALVVGATVPDLAYAWLPWGRTYSHTVSAIAWFSVPLGHVIVRDVRRWGPQAAQLLGDFTGIRWTHVIKPRAPHSTTTTLLCIALGALTHVVWDGLSHPDPTFVQRWSPLRSAAFDAGGDLVPLMQWFSHGCSLFGAIYTYTWLRRHSRSGRSAVDAAAIARSDRTLVIASVAAFASGLAAGLRWYGECGPQLYVQWGLVAAYAAARTRTLWAARRRLNSGC
jgi:hypothetical protein